MALAQTTNQILRSAGEGTEVVANSPITGNGTSEQPLGIDENWHGQDGESVTFTVSAIPSGTRVTLSGAQGTESFDVMNGVDGTNGTDGAQGPAGPQGPQGDPGVQGETGPQGIQGERGPAGPQGEQGEQGPAGQDGAPGKSAYEIAVEDGFSGNVYEWLESLKGDPGEDGKNAYELAVEAGFTGTSAEWLDSLVGPQGPEGPSGASGASGFSPTVSTTPITTGTSGTQVTITDLTGSHTFDIMNGAKGDQGPSGESYTGALMPLIGDNGISVTSNAGNAVVEISSVAHDATLSGNGTVASPLGVVGGGGKTYSGISPIVVNNVEDKISADCIELSAGNGIDSVKLATGVIECSGTAIPAYYASTATIKFENVAETLGASGIVFPYDAWPNSRQVYNYYGSAAASNLSSFTFKKYQSNGYEKTLLVYNDNGTTGASAESIKVWATPQEAECKVVIVSTSGDIPASGATDGKLYVVTGT